MSDEFIRVATLEINQELESINTILQSCSSDLDVAKNSGNIEQHMHKIKGLAPMMGKENVGNLAKILDSVLKQIVSGKKTDGFFEPFVSSISQMKIAMDNPHDLSKIQKQILTFL